MQTVSDIMHGVVYITEDRLLRTAAVEMIKNHRGSVIVKDKDSKIIGILTERDILRLVAEGVDLQKTRIQGNFTKEIISADESTSLEEASNIMDKHGIRRLAITRGDKIIGIVTTRDISKHLRFNIARSFLSESFRPNLQTGQEGRNYR